ncbi:12814_t:CDS:2, partial [Cetraspora pellucida]
KSQNSMVVFKDLENTVIQVSIKKINAIITDEAANYICNLEENYEDKSQNLEESKNSKNPEEEIMKIIENIDILDSNDQNAYCKVASEYSQVVSYDENILENWLLFDKLDNI